MIACLPLHGGLRFAQPCDFPTANHTLLQPGGEERFFVGTVGKPWATGRFGCVRTDGWQMHEGLDIKCIQRDSAGEPLGPVLAAADGTVAYFSAKPSLSNYGNYVVLRHRIDGLEVYSLYAHLKKIREDLKIGQAVRSGEAIAAIGRTTNTREAISRDRAHLHFEWGLFVHEPCPRWHTQPFPTQRISHAEKNARNLLGLNPCRRLVIKRGGHWALARNVNHLLELLTY